MKIFFHWAMAMVGARAMDRVRTRAMASVKEMARVPGKWLGLCPRIR